MCPADAPNEGKSSEPQQNVAGIGHPRSSDGIEAILSALLQISNQLDKVIEQQEEMIFLLQGEEQDDGPGPQTRDMAGRPIQ